MKTNRLRRRSINLDDVTHQRCRMLADSMTLSISSWLRLTVKEIWEKQMIVQNQQAAHLPTSIREDSGSPTKSGNV